MHITPSGGDAYLFQIGVIFMGRASLHHLQDSLSQIDTFVRVAVNRARSNGQDPADALRGLLVSSDEIEDYLGQDVMAGLWSTDAEFDPARSLPSLHTENTPLGHLIQAFNLSHLESYIFMICLIPELDRRYERLYAYLQDDISQRYPTVNLIMNLLGGDVEQRFVVWRQLAAHAPLRRYHLIHCAPDAGRNNTPFLAYQTKVENRIVDYLLGDMTPDEHLKDSVYLAPPRSEVDLNDTALAPIYGALRESPMVYIQGIDTHYQHDTAAALCHVYDLPLLVIDFEKLADLDLPFEMAWQLALREAALQNAAVLIDKWKVCLAENHQPPAALWRELATYPLPVFICGEKNWEPEDRHRQRRLLRLTLPVPEYPERLKRWLQSDHIHNDHITEDDLSALANKFRFTHTQIDRTIQTAADLAQSRGENITVQDLYAGAQAHASLQLGHLAKRIIPRYTWSDLILPPDQLAQLKEVVARARYSHIVQSEWGFGTRAPNGYGISALFAGESGTGKTLASEVIAHELGLVLYKIDLSAVVSKYIGETEKNLSVIFTEARSSNAILFFDEADALFGKRSEVKDARDRYANIEVAYLLQEIEAYTGIAILATNLRQNLDEAFTRRLDFMVDFPFPDGEHRRHIWAVHFPPQAPLSKEVDLSEVAERYRLTGGNIRNATLAAAYLAAADGGVITPEHIRNAVRREHQKMGRLINDDF